MKPEETLIALCRKKDPGAMEELYRMHCQKMFGVCLRYTKNKMDAQDIMHDGFVKVFTGIGEYSGKGSFEGWIRRIMVNTAINQFRKVNGRFVSHDDVPEENDAGITEDAVSQMTTSEIMAMIGELPEGYRIVFNLYVIEGYQHNEIAEMLGVSESTSKTQLLKARKCLMRKINKETYEKVY